jgi:hypothetical protein
LQALLTPEQAQRLLLPQLNHRTEFNQLIRPV